MIVGVVGAGAISEIYLSNMTNIFDQLHIKSICAAHIENAQKKAEQYQIQACTFDEMLEDQEIEMIVNLTPANTHYEIISKTLKAGKHVYTEKPLADTLEKASELLKLADEKGLYLGSAPDTFLGSALQTARKAIDDGLIGEVTSCAAAANRDNNILLSIFGFLSKPGGGACLDYGIYYITALVSLLGPIRRTAAFVRAPYQTHSNINPTHPQYGKPFSTPNESQVSAILQFDSGITGTFSLNNDSIIQDQAFIAIYGTKGVLFLPDPNQFGNEVRFQPGTGFKDNFAQKDCVTLPALYNYSENSRGLGAADMADAIMNHTENRANKQLAYHVMEVLESFKKSSETGSFINIASTCKRPAPMDPVCS